MLFRSAEVKLLGAPTGERQVQAGQTRLPRPIPEPGEGVGGGGDAAQPAHQLVEVVDLEDGPAGDEIRAQSPFGRVARASEIAAAVLYLASPQAEWASGTIIDLNGASYLR